jgi:hypothetical protein
MKDLSFFASVTFEQSLDNLRENLPNHIFRDVVILFLAIANQFLDVSAFTEFLDYVNFGLLLVNDSDMNLLPVVVSHDVCMF